MINGKMAVRRPNIGGRSRASEASIRRWRRWRKWVWLGLAVLLVSSVVWYALSTHLMTIKRIRVQTLVKVSPDVINEEAITRAGQKWRGKWIWTDLSSLKKEVEKSHPSVKLASIGRQWPDTIMVDLLPRVPLCQIVTGDGAFLIDRDGMVFGHLEEPAEKIPQLRAEAQPRVGKTVSASGAVLGLAVISSLRGYAPSLKEAQLHNGQLVFTMQNDMKVMMSDSSPVSVIIPELDALMSRFETDKKFPHELDMRFDRPVLRW